MVRDLIVVERELGFSYDMAATGGADHYQQICPRCRRALYGLAQSGLWNAAGTHHATDGPALRDPAVR